MKKIIILVFVFLACLSESVDAQRLITKSKEVGLNVTPLLTQLIPFSNGTRKAGPFGFVFRSGKNGKYFNLELGVQIFDVDNVTEENHFNLAIGSLRKNPIGKKFVFYNSYNFILSAGSFNEPNDPSDGDNFSLGLSYGPGIEYHLTDNFFIGTETHLFAGLSSDFFRLHIIPPIGIFLIVKLN